MFDRPTIYALLVGINAYPNPIPRLHGCLNDVRRIQDYLQSQVSPDTAEQLEVRYTESRLSVISQGALQLCVLEDETATYNNIIAGFREHLRHAGPQDVVWFHFSGHGTESYTAPEFRENLEPAGKDQNLVCYTRRPEEEHFLLADKELAVLLDEVANDSAKEKAPHMIVSLDCCHSGSGTRDIDWEQTDIKPRMANLQRFDDWSSAAAAGGVRNLNTYLAGHFLDRALDLPLSEHILFSACTSIQTAGDQAAGGIFTTSLLEALKTTSGPLNYADLFLRTRATVRRRRKTQLPQFETIGGFDPYREFLNGCPSGTPSRFEMVKEGDPWLIKCGAIHGIPMRPRKPIIVEIEAPNGPGEIIGRGEIVAVGAQKSQVEISSDLQLDPEAFYQARIVFLPLPSLEVGLTGNEAALQALIDHWQADLGIRWVREAAEIAEAELLVNATPTGYELVDQRTGKQVFSVIQKEDMENLVISSLGKIVRWERTLAIENPKSRIRQWVDLEMNVLLHGNQTETRTEQHLSMNAADTSFIQHQDMLLAGFQPRVRIKKRRQRLHCYLFHLRSDYSIQAYEGELTFRPEEHPGTGDLVLPLLKTHKGWGLGADDQVARSYFKLFVTTEPLDYQQLIQSGLGGDRAANWNWQPVGVSDDWCEITTEVAMHRT